MLTNDEEPRTRRWTQWVGPAVTAPIAALSQLPSSTSLRVPNPPAFLVLSIVFSAFQGGPATGLISLRRVIVWALTMPATAALVDLADAAIYAAKQAGRNRSGY